MLRRLILAAADRVCTKKQRAAVALLLEGLSTVEIARRMGVGQSTAHRHLYGHATQGGGALQKLQAALVEDQEFLKEMTMAKTDDTPNDDDVRFWFSQMRPSIQDSMFVPLAVLLVMHKCVDAKRTMRIDDLFLHLPKRAINASLSPLRAAGYISFDGTHITIRRTPLDELSPREAA